MCFLGWSYLFKGAFFWLDLPHFTSDSPHMTVTQYFLRTPPSESKEYDRSITDSQVGRIIFTKIYSTTHKILRTDAIRQSSLLFVAPYTKWLYMIN